MGGEGPRSKEVVQTQHFFCDAHYPSTLNLVDAVFEQSGSSLQHRWGDSEHDVCGCPVSYGPLLLHPLPVVCSTASGSYPSVPLVHYGSRCLRGCGGNDPSYSN